MKKIGIDARLYSQTGVGTYLKNLLYYLDDRKIENEIYFVYFLPGDFQNIQFKNKKIIKRMVNARWHSLSEQLRFVFKLYQDDLDLVHFTYFSYPILYLKKFIATVHDTTPLLFKTGKASTKNPVIYSIKHLFFKLILFSQVKLAAKIIVPTDTVKKQLEKIYGNAVSKKTLRIYEGVNYLLTKTIENTSLSKKFNDFFIYVGNFYPHKNVENLIQAFSTVKTKSQLLLIGPKDFFANRLIQQIKNLNQEKGIIFIHNPSISDLLFFYKNAKALIHPSLSEGFGLPLIEAANYNCPIIASNIEVFKELLGSCYLSFDPKNIKDIGEKITQFIHDKPKINYNSLMKKYSFENMTEQTIKVYNETLYEL